MTIAWRVAFEFRDEQLRVGCIFCRNRCLAALALLPNDCDSMQIFAYLNYFILRLRGKLNLEKASLLLARNDFSSTKTRQILRRAGAAIGEGCRICSPRLIEKRVQLSIAENTFINIGLTIVGAEKVSIGRDCLIGPYLTVATVNHPLDPVARREPGTATSHPVCVGSNVWIGANVTLCAGVSIGDNAVIGAGSVVTRNIPANTFAAGIPCKPLRDI